MPHHETTKIYSEIAGRYDEPWRHYHTVRHLSDVVSYLVENIDELEQPRPTLWAAVGHDAVYVPQAPIGVNEELSAQLMEDVLEQWLPEDEVRTVGRYIRATASHEVGGDDYDLALLMDADMKILGANPQEYDRFERGIAREYSAYPREAYRAGRAAVLGEFLSRPRIYVTDIAYQAFEQKARDNMRTAIDSLQAN